MSDGGPLRDRPDPADGPAAAGTATADPPSAQYVAAERVLDEIALEGRDRLRLPAVKIFVLAALGGAFITVGALFSVLLATGIETPGIERLVEGFGFSAGFFFVILSHAVLFTEANVVVPTTMLGNRRRAVVRRALTFWPLAWLGNFVGAFVVAGAIALAQDYPADVTALLDDVLARKLTYRDDGTVGAWLQIVLSGVLANWLVGMAAFFSVMGRTIIGKYIPVFLAVTVFVAANFQHSPANIGFFSLANAMGDGPGWATAFGWSIIPAGIGNILGGVVLVAMLLWYALRGDEPSGTPAEG